MQKFIEYVCVTVSTYKKNPGLLILSSTKKKSYWVVHMPNEGRMPPLLVGYNMDVLSKFLMFIVLFIP